MAGNFGWDHLACAYLELYRGMVSLPERDLLLAVGLEQRQVEVENVQVAVAAQV